MRAKITQGSAREAFKDSDNTDNASDDIHVESAGTKSNKRKEAAKYPMFVGTTYAEGIDFLVAMLKFPYQKTYQKTVNSYRTNG